MESRLSVAKVPDPSEALRRKQVEEALRASEARLLRAHEAGGIGSYEWDMISGEGEQSDSMLRLIGLPTGRRYTLKEVCANVLPEDMPAVIATVKAISAGERRRRTVYRYRREADGKLRWMQDIGQVEVDSAGRPVRWVGVVQDITEQKEAEERLRESEERLRLAQDAGGLGLWDWDIASGGVVWSGSFRRLWGVAPEVAPSFQGWLNCVHPNQREDVARSVEEALAACTPWSSDIRVAGSDPPRWLTARGEFHVDVEGKPTRMLGVCWDISDRKRWEHHQQLLVGELNHRVKNTLAIVQSLAHQTFRGDTPPADAIRAFEGRLEALAAAHNLLTRENWEAADLLGVAREALQVHSADPARLMLDGPQLRIAPKMAVTIAIALHELATNATKYGALSQAGGEVAVRWAAEDGRLDLSWEERGGPPVRTPERRGFGSRMIEQALARELGGQVTLSFAPEGVRCRLLAPLPSVGPQSA